MSGWACWTGKFGFEEVRDMIEKEATFAVWVYYLNDDGKARWRCSACGKICRRNPHEKHYCSCCGAKMRMEA